MAEGEAEVEAEQPAAEVGSGSRRDWGMTCRVYSSGSFCDFECVGLF